MYANYHTHTALCHHAGGTEREYIECAIKAGFKVLGFSDHSPQIFENGHISGIRMEPSKAKEYAENLRKLKKEYSKDIEIHIGFEAEYYPEIFGGLVDLCRKNKIEYLILGQHSIGTDGSKDCFWSGKRNSNENLLKRYVDLIVEGIKTGKFSYIAHPDIFNFDQINDTYLKEMERLCVAAKKLNVPLEYNLLGLSDNRAYPRDEFLSISKSVNNEIIIGCDAHNPNVLLDTELQKRAREHLDSLGLNVIDTLKLKSI